MNKMQLNYGGEVILEAFALEPKKCAAPGEPVSGGAAGNFEVQSVDYVIFRTPLHW